MLKQILATIAGIATTMLIIMALEMFVEKNYFTVGAIDLKDTQALKHLMETVPIQAFVCLLLGYAIGSFGGGLVATWIAGRETFRPAVIVGMVAMAGGIMNLVQIPHPLWFVVGSQFMYVPFAYLGYLIVKRR